MLLGVVKLVMDRIANRPRGFAFLRYKTEEESKKAIEGMHGKVSITFQSYSKLLHTSLHYGYACHISCLLARVKYCCCSMVEFFKTRREWCISYH